MNIEKLNPWNWFKHESGVVDQSHQIPVSRRDAELPSVVDSGLYPMMKFHQDIDRMFDDVFSRAGLPSLRTSFGTFPQKEGNLRQEFTPNIDVSGDKSTYQVVLDVPGMNDKDLSIDVSGNVLTIRGQKEEKSEHEDKQFYRVERSYGSFQRTLSLPDDADASDIHAALKNGVLELSKIGRAHV